MGAEDLSLATTSFVIFVVYVLLLDLPHLHSGWLSIRQPLGSHYRAGSGTTFSFLRDRRTLGSST